MSNKTAADIRESLRLFFLQHPHIEHWVVAYSGGLDSSLLLKLCSELLPSDRLSALHINHQLQSSSDKWERFCAESSFNLGVSFESEKVTCDTSSEESARLARYSAFNKRVKPKQALLLAHHQDDQAETVLFNLFRGSGVNGLSGIASNRAVGEGALFRPLLNTTKSDIESAAKELQIAWVDDPSNLDTRFTRNWIRRELSGVLNAQWPDWKAKLAKTASRLSEASELHEALAQMDLERCQLEEGVLSLVLLFELSLARKKNLLYHWLSSAGQRVGSEKQLESIAKLDVKAKGEWPFSTVMLRAYDEKLFLSPNSELQPCESMEWVVSDEAVIFGPGQLSAIRAETGLPIDMKLTLRTREPGESVYIESRGGHVSIKKLMNEHRIPPWLRECWPIVCSSDQVVAIPEIWLDKKVCVKDGFLLNWVV